MFLFLLFLLLFFLLLFLLYLVCVPLFFGWSLMFFWTATATALFLLLSTTTIKIVLTLLSGLRLRFDVRVSSPFLDAFSNLRFSFSARFLSFFSFFNLRFSSFRFLRASLSDELDVSVSECWMIRHENTNVYLAHSNHLILYNVQLVGRSGKMALHITGARPVKFGLSQPEVNGGGLWSKIFPHIEVWYAIPSINQYINTEAACYNR